MSAENFALTTSDTRALGEHLLAMSERRQPIFWIALAIAAFVHVAAIVGIGQSTPNRIGDPDGAADAIDVEIVDASAFHKKMGIPDPADSATATPPSAAVPPPPPDQPQAEPEAEQQPQQEPETPPAETPPKEAAPKEVVPALPAEEAAPKLPDPAPEKQKSKQKEAEKSEPEPAPKESTKAETKPKPETKPKTKAQPKLKPPQNLDLSLPTNMDGEPSSGSAPKSSGVSRPPGITRSGANDRFGRAVIRALKRTMPPPMGIVGRVTIRIILNERGNVASVKLVESGGNRSLDGEVLFAAGQTSYPFPPDGSTQIDRTFLVTYIYK